MPEGIPGVETTSAPLSPVPSQAEQAEQITRLQEAEERHAGDTCYLVACRWYQAFRQYVGIRRQGDILSLAMAGQERKHPGPIDNSSLLGEIAFLAVSSHPHIHEFAVASRSQPPHVLFFCAQKLAGRTPR